MEYEFRHMLPFGDRRISLLLDGDDAALLFARLIEAGFAVQVWKGNRKIGAVEPRYRSRDTQTPHSAVSM